MEIESGELRTETTPRKPDMVSRLGALFEIILAGIAGFIIVPVLLSFFGVGTQKILSDSKYLVTLLSLEATLTLVFIWAFLRLHGQGIKYIGWDWGSGVAKEFVIALFSLPLLFIATFITKSFFQAFFPEYVTEENPLLGLVETPLDLLLLAFTSLYVGGIKEEFQRAFVLIRFDGFLGGIWPGLILWTFFFAYGHSIQGVDNAAGAGVLGLCFGLLFIWRRRLIAPVIAHTLYNVTTVVSYWLLMNYSS